ncbi:anthranilate synthase component II [Heyndrickxia sporothermodurans]|uniref:Aminodeoxychorismate/anthranilate synthase component II n=1 Tax=Heyndrickxia sporothermodurans TaxID=46224 RepID=A0A150LH77_9BACI|nr:aminodeoxychorismate/anthranilate synthase component II [Heyndrickxia sporothermodurans]KYD11369.1 Anthranilate synthase, amidotransferase component [Heyndrickxia sporothermodurans]MBL5766195.1 aminodeoxychorismate/anthranilate synthase component II [Heyndrickxia sporothermodurans]MBL5769635.1 aminodeoxychorismate/anthranilate synthase component II [Heyndrickxia sporothermodurans]MBL5774824.1 aminodeoxychorismate/anthranilate synthase component II [Heyndrickxia sporothermodurans]MBL5778860.
MIILLDNYDSFTYNLFQYLSELGEEVKVFRNDGITIEQITEMKPEAIVLSPGPGTPEQAGICMEVIKACYQNIPILGVCLGHQAIAAAFGATIVQAKEIKHGKISRILHCGEGMFQYMSQPLEVMRYHSLVIDRNSLSSEFIIAATSMDDQEIMAIKHEYFPLYGVQFHPESIGTKTGKDIIRNFLMEMRKENSYESIS